MTVAPFAVSGLRSAGALGAKGPVPGSPPANTTLRFSKASRYGEHRSSA